MSKRQIIILLGVLIIIIALFSGFPTLWNTIAYIVVGVLIIMTAYTIQPQTKESEDTTSAPFIETQTPPQI